MTALRFSNLISPMLLAALALSAAPAIAEVYVQCPGDINGDAIPDGPPPPGVAGPVKCKHLAGGDGFAMMANGDRKYIFSFSDVTGIPEADVIDTAAVGANLPAPSIIVDEGDKLYLTLSNVGLVIRPDLFDPHSVHYHGFPNAASAFDGLPETSIVINPGASLTYFYANVEPGTYLYHCHVEATEHMQMGMLGNLYVHAARDKQVYGGTRHFAYNDDDDSTEYNVEFALQLGSMDREFHDLHEAVQPLPFALMQDDYPMINGRGYPDTVKTVLFDNGDGKQTQKVSSLVTAAPGQKILIRLSNLSVTQFFTFASQLPMRVVGRGARILRGPYDAAYPLRGPDSDLASHTNGGNGNDLYYTVNSVTLGGGEAMDLLIDTAGLSSGDTYVLYAADLYQLSNDDEDFGGMMTEIHIQ